MSFDKEKDNGAINNFYNHSLHGLYNNGSISYNSTSPATSPSVGNYSMPLYRGSAITNGSANSNPNTAFRYLQQQQNTQSMMGNHTPTETSAVASPAGGNAGITGVTTPHLALQLKYAQTSRQSSSPHHHARAAAAMARNTPISSTVTITDPNDPNKMFTNGTSTNSIGNKKSSSENDDPVWTSLDMGGMGLKNISSTLCNYHFLTSLYINHNNLTYLMSSLSLLRSLRILDASGNKLSMLPAELGMLTNLRELLLFDNNIATLPIEFGNLYQLEILGLEGNPIQPDLKSLLVKDGTQAVIMSLRENAPVGMPPPHREWLLIEGDTLEDPDKFTVLDYNTLCNKYATSQLYGYTPSWALNWEYRKELLASEILSYNADVICLQEVEMGEYEDYFKEHFKRMGDYDSVFYVKTRAKTMAEKERRTVDGCATFYKTTRFRLLDHESIEYNQKALQRTDFKQTTDVYNRVMNKDNIALLVMLEDSHTKQRVMVSNTHLHWHPKDSDVKLVQIGVMMEEIKKFTSKHLPQQGQEGGPTYSSNDKVPAVICGDYNSDNHSGVYEFLSKSTIGQGHDDFGSHSYGAYTTEGLSHNLSLKSSYSNAEQLPFTNYTPDYKGVLDYIWYTNNTLDIISVLGPIDSEYLSKVVGFPNAHFPSDHIPLMAELKFKSPSKKEAVKADFGSATSRNNNNNRLK